MRTTQIPYDEFADRFDRGRALSEAKEATWFDLFKKHLGLCQASRVLDLGCGTGRFSILIARRQGCSVIGVDPSRSMLAKARTKSPHGVQWTCGRGEAIPSSAGTFDVCLVSQVIQHFQNKPLAIAEIHRVLRPGGRVGIRLSSHAQLATILDYRFFPSGLHIELERLPDVHIVKEMLLTAGLDHLEEHSVRQPLFTSAADYLDKLRDKYASFLHLISEEEYHRGLKEATDYLCSHKLDNDMYAEITFLVGVNG